MARDIITSSTTEMPQAGSADQGHPAPADRTPEPPARKDALAEAFPAWDLVPSVPFVRRVK